jgi:hypothetical protein
MGKKSKYIFLELHLFHNGIESIEESIYVEPRFSHFFIFLDMTEEFYIEVWIFSQDIASKFFFEIGSVMKLMIPTSCFERNNDRMYSKEI